MLQTDYLIVGAGAVGMAFADEILTSTDAHVTLVDRRAMPGGHWNETYPFVRLHQPSVFYGAGSRPLGSGRIDGAGWNRGYYELASGAEVAAYFDALMRERFLPSGRVTFLPMHDHVGGGRLVSRLTGEAREVRYRRLVDATYFDTRTPSTHPPAYAVGEDVRLTTPRDLPRVAPDHRRFVILGAGKTAMDVGVWLLEMGVRPAAIRWVRPRDGWMIDRESVQPGDAFYNRSAGIQARILEAAAAARDKADLFDRLEKAQALIRLDRNVTPTMYRGATISRAEVAMLAQIRDVVRLGRVQSIDRARITLDGGDVPATPDALYIDCTATALPERPPMPVFDGDRITIQAVRANLISVSAAVIAHVEATGGDEAAKNALCRPIPVSRTDDDWLRLTLADLENAGTWSSDKALRAWLGAHRLSGRDAGESDPSLRDPEIAVRTRAARPAAMANLARLMAQGQAPKTRTAAAEPA